MTQELTKDILEEYGFKIVDSKTKDRLTVLVGDRVEIIIVDDGTVMYSNMGFDYPLPDLPALKKLYKELRRTELTKK
ncbi:MAG: hypothetical protein HYX39_09940 [Bacteroidetes bacterium]|nr:hypothetical protein [Bacteroidota bacterium]